MARVKILPKQFQSKVSDKFPNFSNTGSIAGMKKLFYGKDALLVQCGSYIYNVSSDPSIYYNLAH